MMSLSVPHSLSPSPPLQFNPQRIVPSCHRFPLFLCSANLRGSMNSRNSRVSVRLRAAHQPVAGKLEMERFASISSSNCPEASLVGVNPHVSAPFQSYRYGRSMFERFQRAVYPVTRLKMQYRMHPEGREKDVAIFSCVRASKKGSIGFVVSSQRMNVGITRAKSSILVVGSASTLRKDIHWNNLVENAEKGECLVKVSKPYTAFFSDDSLESMRTKEEVSPNKEVQIDELDYSMHSYNVGDAGEAQGDDNVYGDGDDMDMVDGGFGDD